MNIFQLTKSSDFMAFMENVYLLNFLHFLVMYFFVFILIYHYNQYHLNSIIGSTFNVYLHTSHYVASSWVGHYLYNFI